METKFNFNSQVATSRFQSERLLALGLKKETADMCWQTTTLNGEAITYPSQDVWLSGSIITNNHFPAWSMHRLIEMATTENIQISFYKNQVKVWGRICREEFEASYYDKPNVFDNFICGIEWLIKEGCFNKEYLEE